MTNTDLIKKSQIHAALKNITSAVRKEMEEVGHSTEFEAILNAIVDQYGSVGSSMSDSFEALFELVRNREDWKAPIDSTCRAVDREAMAKAIEWFTATIATFESTDDPEILRVRADGYRRGPAGDH